MTDWLEPMAGTRKKVSDKESVSSGSVRNRTWETTGFVGEVLQNCTEIG